MEVIQIKAKRRKDGSYKIELPKTISERPELDVVVVIEEKSIVQKSSALFQKFAGVIKTKTNWNTYQQILRNEWE